MVNFKNLSLNLILILVISTQARSQTLQEIARTKNLTWYGVNFSLARLNDFDPTLKCSEIKDSLISYWNSNFTSEPGQSFLKRKFEKEELRINSVSSDKNNNAINCEVLLNNQANDVDIEKIKNIIKEYEFASTGFGVLMVVESFDNINDRALIWVVYINNAYKTIISGRRYNASVRRIGRAKIFSLKSSWLGAIETVIRDSAKDLLSINKSSK